MARARVVLSNTNLYVNVSTVFILVKMPSRSFYFGPRGIFYSNDFIPWRWNIRPMKVRTRIVLYKVHEKTTNYTYYTA